MTAGYSGTPLNRKLGIKPELTVTAVNAPKHYRRLLGRLPAGVKITQRLGDGPLDFIHCFATERSLLTSKFAVLERALAPAGALWISWPKGSSRVATDLTEDVIRAIGLAHGLVDVKVCAVDETWSGLKFVRRLRDRT